MASASSAGAGGAPRFDGGVVLTKAITETPNELTTDIDVAGAEGIVRILRQTDAQIFSGWKGLPGLYDDPTTTSVGRVAKAATDVLRHVRDGEKGAKRGLIVMTGSGTSGRIAMMTARSFNASLASVLHSNAFDYLASGGDFALLLSDELPEDDPNTGQKELAELVEGYEKVLFIGITCGISAPYALGQVQWAMKQPHITTVLLGFNPVHLGRNVPVEGWDKTCRDIAMELGSSTDPRHIVLNPVVGPEPITGSTRMKGGTTTKILLETALALAVEDAFGLPVAPPRCLPRVPDESDGKDVADDSSVAHRVNTLFHEYEQTARHVYFNTPDLAGIIRTSAECLKNNGHLYYVGGHASGMIGLVDASEMVDTYGADVSDVRGFLQGGWVAMQNKEGPSVRERDYYCHISIEDFLTDVFPSLTENDCVLFTYIQGESFPDFVVTAETLASKTPCKLAYLTVSQIGGVSPAIPSPLLASGIPGAAIKLPRLSNFGSYLLAEVALKWAINAVSTASQILKGAVYQNRMINVGVLNNKLYYRSIDLICLFSGAEKDFAETCLLKSIHEVDDLTAEIMGFPVSKHIQTATDKKNVVPAAMLMGTGKFSRAEAHAALVRQPVIREVIKGLQSAV